MSSQANEPEIKYDNLLDYFQFYLLPLALMIGMTPNQFWEDNPDDLWAYWDAYEMRKKREAEEKNINNFNLGQYFMLAVAQCLQFSKHPKKIYPKKPFELQNKKVKMSNKDYNEIRKIDLKEKINRFNNI